MEDMEWLLARAAGFDAGFGLAAGIGSLKAHGFSEKILTTIREWETARLSGAFTSKQKEELRDIRKEFHLAKETANGWKLYPVQVSYFEHQSMVKQPGEPLSSSFTFSNPHQAQAMQFIITLRGETRNGRTPF